jgi:hypothetical protein
MIGESSEEKYKRMLKTYGKLMGKPMEEIVDELKKKQLSDGYIKNILCAMKWFEKDENRKKEYSNEIIKISVKESKKEKHKNKFKKIDWEKIGKVKGESVDDIIKGIYTMMPPRRVKDYAFMAYVKNKSGVDDDDKNYYVAKDKKFIFQNYKTKKTYGVQEINIPKELNDLLKKYIKNSEIKEHEPLLKYREYGKKKIFDERNLRRKLTNIFGTSVDGLRHGYITWLYKNPKNLYKIEEISEKMGHDVKTHLRYLDNENNN